MELKIHPYHKNMYPLGGILIKGDMLSIWVAELQAMQFALTEMAVYPIPGTKANSIWGCLITYDAVALKKDAGHNTYCQVINDLLFIPERTAIQPSFSAGELARLLKGKRHLLHPMLGIFELGEPIDWKSVITIPVAATCSIITPSSAVNIPWQIRTFQIKPVAVTETLKVFEEKNFPKREKFKEKPLNIFEKIKLVFYKQLFVNIQQHGQAGETKSEKTWLLEKLNALRNYFKKKEDNWMERLQVDYEALEKRNQKHLDRLLDLLKNNPQEALKYAIPLDMNGTARGGAMGFFDMQKRWFDFSLFGFDNSALLSTGTTLLPDDAFNKLHNQYSKIAEDLVKQNDFKKAAFIYMKLLKNYVLAAQTLDKGGFYQEAAAVYLKYCKDKARAAMCYVKGNMMLDAIELYKELGEIEKAGDLYVSIQKRKEANECYQKVVDDYTEAIRYVKAAMVYKNKIGNMEAAQELLIKGWRLNRDAFNCLNNYFQHIADHKKLWSEIQSVYHNDVTQANREVFLNVLKLEYEKKNELADSLRDMAHEIIVAQAAINPFIISELPSFNKEDKQLVKDTLRFKMGLRK